MNNDLNLLITLYDKQHDTLVRVALKVEDPYANLRFFPMEPESRARLHQLLPAHVRSCGPIVNVETLFEISETSQ